MLWRDLREYLDALRECGYLRDVSGANWQEEIGAITELATEENGPALLFDDIPGYPTGFRVASNLFTTPQRSAMALGLDVDAGDYSVQWTKRLGSMSHIEPVIVDDGPILTNIREGDDVDLFAFPTPKWHEDDGGRYIGTGVCVINEHADTGLTNLGSYRVSVLDAKTCGIFIEHGKHGFQIAQSYWNQGKSCPVAISVGQEPILTALGGSSSYRTPVDVSEYAVAGYLQGEPYRVVKGLVTGVKFPACSEIVIEGFIPAPGQRVEPEGPFGEWTGYYAHGKQPELVVEVKAIYYRDDPIIFGLSPTRPVGCYYSINFGGDMPQIVAMLKAAGIDGVKAATLIGRPHMAVVSMKQQAPDQVEKVKSLLSPGGEQYQGHRTWILVDDDIDPHNLEEVVWAIASRLSPERGVTVVPTRAVWQLDPRIPPGERSTPGIGGRSSYVAHDLILDCCRPYEWIDEFPPVAVNGSELRERIIKQWMPLIK